MLEDGKKHVYQYGKTYLKIFGVGHLCETHLVVKQFISSCQHLFPVSGPKPRLRLEHGQIGNDHTEWVIERGSLNKVDIIIVNTIHLTVVLLYELIRIGDQKDCKAVFLSILC